MNRITPHQQLLQSLQLTQRQTASLNRLQDQISSGVRVERPSQDPGAYRQILTAQSALADVESDLSILQHKQQLANQAHTQIRDAQQLVVQARDIAIQAQQTATHGEVDALALQIRGIRERLISLSNTQLDGRYLFAGDAGNTLPYGVDELGLAGTYQGGGADKTGQASTLPTARQLFEPDAPLVLSITNVTGTQLGTGQPIGASRESLTLAHAATTYFGASGISPGASSASGDNILGLVGTHTLQVNDTSGTGSIGTISLNGGTPVDFTSSDTDLLVIGPNGEQVYLDTTSITAGFNGAVDIEGTGTIQLGDNPAVSIEFGNQQLVSADGQFVRYVDTSTTTETGTETIDAAGGTDLLTALELLEQDILSQGDPAQRHERLAHRLDDLNDLNDHLLVQLGRQSVGLQQLEQRVTKLEDVKLALNERLGQLNATDIADAVLRLQELQNQTEFSLATTVRRLNISILDFLG
ncbi:MAG: hypothetical protein KDA88_09795 [Planctomycetaceae bacterium]|nr:hypothetical protein [Planctomycetaceae bacterium]MCB9952702.1 hypothetical protein [Planctomycetaceae bacterium]